MLLQDIIPSRSVRAYIKCYRIIHFNFKGSRHIPQKIYPPKPEQVLNFYLKDPLQITKSDGTVLNAPTMLFIGQQTKAARYFAGPEFINVQLVFQPTAVFELIGIPASELSEQYIDAGLIFPASVEQVFASLLQASHYDQMIRIVDAFAIELISNSKHRKSSISGACDIMVANHGDLSIEKLASESFLSSKQFKRNFASHVGLTPKAYARLLRLNRAYNVRNCFPSRSWSSIASQCGYGDYQHLAKDYKDFMGMSPAAFHELERSSPEQLLGLSDMIYRSRFSVGS